jgi:pyruvate/2-oxoglutarate dehydrogenase complex dihydrolipoamide dehydrogenase (E3) component
MAERIKTDICVIGAGAGGLSVAAAAAAFGVPVVLIEHGKMGGDCLNVGCVPSKSLIAAARNAHAIARAGLFGLAAGPAAVDFRKVHDHIHSVIAAITPNDSSERFIGLGVRVIAGHARFKNRKTVAVSDTVEIRARRFVVATGSTPALPPIPGLETVPYLTNETVFNLTECPRHLLVLGAGPVGLELAQAFRRLGAAVTVLEAQAPLAREDPECARLLLEALQREGVVLRSGVTVARFEAIETDGATGRAGGGVRAILGAGQGTVEETVEETIEGSHLLVAAGRRANIEGLGLDLAHVEVEAGSIAVDHGLRTSNRRVYAIGDVAGAMQFTHAANHHAGLVIRNALFRLRVRLDEDVIPRVTFTDPELAHVGLTEAMARERKLRFGVLRWPFHENDRAQTERETHGHIKVIVGRRGRVLGATIVGAGAGELITAWTLAVTRRLPIQAFAGTIVPYPTRSEVGKRAATTYFLPAVTNRWVRRMIAVLRRFG